MPPEDHLDIHKIYGIADTYDVRIVRHPVNYDEIHANNFRVLKGEHWSYYGTDCDIYGKFDVLFRSHPVMEGIHEGVEKEQSVVYIRSMFKEALALSAEYIRTMSEEKYGDVLEEHIESANWLEQWKESYEEKFN